MTKQEEIRGGMFQIALPKVCRLRPEIDIKGAQQTQLLVDELWHYLHSQGVVIKTERELPGFIDEVMENQSTDYIAGLRDGIKRLQQAGFGAFDPLI